MFKDLANLGNLMRQAQQSLGRADEIKQKLKGQRVNGVAGGGMVEVEMNGAGEMLSLKIDPDLVANNETDMLEDLIPAAVNDAIQKAKALHVGEMKSLTDGFNIPGLDSAIEKFTG